MSFLNRQHKFLAKKQQDVVDILLQGGWLIASRLLWIGIAVMRHRLWDIDLVINRALVYGMLSTVLALVYMASVLILQQLFQALTGQGSALATIGSTLLIAMLFQPLRRFIQEIIDRRFYRRKYDMVRTINAFNTRLSMHNEVELATLTADVIELVEKTMQPEFVSLWLWEPMVYEDKNITKKLSKKTGRDISSFSFDHGERTA